MFLVVLLQIAFDGAENFRIVIHGQYDWLLHDSIYLFATVVFWSGDSCRRRCACAGFSSCNAICGSKWTTPQLLFARGF